MEAVSLFPGVSWGRGRTCLHSTSPIPCSGGIGYVVVVVVVVVVVYFLSHIRKKICTSSLQANYLEHV